MLTHFNLHNQPVRQVLLFLVEWGTKMLNNLAKITSLLSGGVKILTLAPQFYQL